MSLKETKKATETTKNGEVSQKVESNIPSIEDMQTELESVQKQYNECINARNLNDEMAKRCLGAMELLQRYIGTPEVPADA